MTTARNLLDITARYIQASKDAKFGDVLGSGSPDPEDIANEYEVAFRDYLGGLKASDA